MNHRSNNTAYNKLSVIIFGLLISMVFIVPLFIHPFKLTISPSTDYQFNNIIAVLIMLILLILAQIIYLRFYGKETDFDNIGKIFNHIDNNQLKAKHLYIALAIFLVIIVIFYLIGADYGYGEANYFLLRIDRIKLGQVPYKNFEYAYGLLLLDLPVLLSKVFNISTVQAYYVAYAFFNCLGLYFLYYIINSFNINIKSKKYLFYSITFCCVPFCIGVNYTLSRFITPIMCLIIIDGLLKKKYKNNNYYVLIISAISFVSVMLVLSISIEVGIAIGVSIGSYFFISFLFNKDFRSLSIAIVYSSLIILFSFFFNKNLVLTLKVFASGGNNFPVIPAPAILFYIVSFLIINSIFISLVINKKIHFITFTLLLFNIAMLPGAFGRCDPGHIFWYGLCSFICMWVYLSYTNHRFYKVYRIFFILIFTIGSTLSTLFLYRGVIANTTAKFIVTHASIRNRLNKGLRMFHVNSNSVDLYLDKKKTTNNFKRIDSCALISLPFDVDKDLYLHVLNSKRYSPEYYTGVFLNVFTPEQIAEKLTELKDKKHVYMIIPQSLYNYKPEHQNEADANRFISALFLFPFHYDRKKYSEDLYTPVYSYLRSNYKIIEKYNNDYLIERL
ncbi:MAG: hypothetical protein JWQ63_3679 [Mucilaginibacter sp.]|nr:hypothetical protein [Mucilaginibacter sp.]